MVFCAIADVLRTKLHKALDGDSTEESHTVHSDQILCVITI